MVAKLYCLQLLPKAQCQAQKSQMLGRSERSWTVAGSAPKVGHSLKVLQWNVLADGLAQHGDFVKV